MALTLQNLRAVGAGVEPASLLPGQIAFNITDKVIYVGDGSDFRTNFDGTQVAGVVGNGWYSMPMDYNSLETYFLVNPEAFGDTPSNNDVLIWSSANNRPSWGQISSGGITGLTSTAPITLDLTDPQVPDIGVSNATTLAPGVVQLNDTVVSSSSTQAATASAAKTAYDAGIQGQADAAAAQSTADQAVLDSAAAQADATQALSDAAAAQADATQALSDAGAAQSTADQAILDAAAAQSTADAAVPDSSFTAAGDLLVGTGAGTFSSLPAGAADYILASDGAGSLVWVSQSEGDVTGVTGTAPITVDNTDPQNPIVGVDLATTATPGVVQVDPTGNISIVAGVINIPDASTAVKGAVQLNNTLSSSSTNQALTAAQGAALQAQIDALTLSNSVILAGGYNADTGVVDGVTSQGTAAGFTDGSAPPAASATNVDHYLIATTSGNIPSAMENGDWLLSVETSPGVYAYQVLGVGARPASASYTQAGIVQLADAVAVLAGTSDTTAITPQSLQDNVSDSVTTSNSNLIASSTAVKTAYDFAVGADSAAAAAQLSADNAQADATQALADASAAQADATQALSDAAAAQADADQALLDAAAAQATANAAMPKAGGTFTGNVVFDNTAINSVEGSFTFENGSSLELSAGSTVNVNNSAALNILGQIVVDAGGIADFLSGSAVNFYESPYWDTGIVAAPALNVSYDNATSGLAATNVQDAIDEIVSENLWTESAGVLSPSTAGNAVNIPVTAGVDGLKVEDTALSFSTAVKPDQIHMIDNVQSLNLNSNTSVITHTVDSLLTNTAGVVAQDEAAQPTPYDIFASYLRVNGASGITLRTLPWPQIESADSMNINIANFFGALGIQAGGNDLVLIGGDNGGGESYLQTQPNVLLEALGRVHIIPNVDITNALSVQTSGSSSVLTVNTVTPGVTIGDGATSYTFPIADGSANYILSTDGAGTVSWVANAADGVQGVTGTSPITVDNTDPANPVVGIDAASTTAAGAVQLNDTVTSTSTTEAATANAVKAAYDAAVAAATSLGPLTSDTVLYVNCTDGNDTTGARGTDRPFATIAAAIAAASNGDTIFLSAGTFTENFTIDKGVHLAGTFCDQATWSGTKILGNVVVNLVGAGVVRNLAVSDIYFISANSTSPLSITGMSPGAGGINTFTNCTFTQQTVTDTAQFAFQTSGTWTRSVYLRGCTIDGNFKHNAGTAAGASGYIVIDALLGVGNSNMYHSILTGTVEYRNPSNSLASIYQTGGVVLVNNASSGITANSATTTSIFGGTGFSYKGTAAAAGAGTIYFQGGSNQGSGKVDIGANVIYGWTNLTIDPANLTVSGSAIAYTTAVPSAANAQAITQQRPRLDLLKTSSSVTAANQLGTVVDSSTGTLYSVSSFDAGTY